MTRHLIESLLENLQRFKRRAGKEFPGLRDGVIDKAAGLEFPGLGIDFSFEPMQDCFVGQLIESAVDEVGCLLEGVATNELMDSELEFLERGGSFSHVEKPEAVFALIREFTGQ